MKFDKLHAYLEQLYNGHLHNEAAESAELSALSDLFGKVASLFTKSAKHVYDNKGFKAEMLGDEPVKKLTQQMYQTLNNAVQKGLGYEVPEALKEALRKNTFVFSGMKVYTALSEVGSLSFVDEKGNPKSWHEFGKDARKLNVKYNETYLRTEYDFANYSAQQASRWQELSQDTDRYNLQYRTAGDSKVRASHAEMNGITLPADNAFWDSYSCPNGWNCRCEAIQVRKTNHPETDEQEALKLGEAATTQIDKNGKNAGAIFRFNPGKLGKVFPPDHPYTKTDCGELSAIWKTLSAIQQWQLAGKADRCSAKKEVEKQYKSNLAERRITYEKIMSPLLKKSVTKQIAPDKKISIKFNKKGNAHIVDDILNKKGIKIGKGDLDKLHQYLKEAEYEKTSGLYKERKDNIQRFYYFKSKKEDLYYHVAEKAHKTRGGKIKVDRFLYAVTRLI